MNTKKKTGTSRLPSLYGQTLIKAEFDYRREIHRKMDRIQHDNRGAIRRRLANDHVFAHDLLTKRYHWFTVDKSYRDACRTMWNRQASESARTSHVFLPKIYPSEPSSPLTMASYNTIGSNDDDNEILADARIRKDFLDIQPVMLEILRAPHSSKFLKHKNEIELRKKSAQKRQAHIQTTATNDQRYRQLVHSLQQT